MGQRFFHLVMKARIHSVALFRSVHPHIGDAIKVPPSRNRNGRTLSLLKASFFDFIPFAEMMSETQRQVKTRKNIKRRPEAAVLSAAKNPEGYASS